MFDIRDYYREQVIGSAGGNDALMIGDIEEDISFDIDSILMNRFDSLYRRDKFKHQSTGIDIIYPRVSFPGGKSLVKGPDHIRNLLSMYPSQSDLHNLEKVVLRPRHIDIGNIELMALYLRKKKILVMYLHHPHSYIPEHSKFNEYAEHAPFDEAAAVPPEAAGSIRTRPGTAVTVPPLWYILSVVLASDENIIDKFFIRKDPSKTREISRELDEISFYFSRHGY